MIGHFFNLIFFEPLYNGLVFLVGILPLHDLGFAIIILTLVVRFVILPFTHKSVVTQRKMKEIEPEITKIKEKHKNNREEQAKKIMELYREHGVSPFSGFLMLLVQFPVLIALFILLKQGFVLNPDDIYFFIKFPENVNQNFLGILDMAKPSFFLAVLTGVSQFLQIHLSFPKTAKIEKKPGQDISIKAEFQKSMAIQMKYIMPVFILFIAMKFSSGLALYWTTSNVFAIVHEIVVAKKAGKKS